MEDSQIETHEIVWSGITICIRFERNWLGRPPSQYHPTHLQIEAVQPPREPLPIIRSCEALRPDLRSCRVAACRSEEGPTLRVSEAKILLR